MRKQKNVYLGCVLLLSLCVGIAYNALILPQCAEKTGNTFLTDYLVYLIGAACLSYGLVFLLSRLKNVSQTECFAAGAVPFVMFCFAIGEKDIIINVFSGFLSVFALRRLMQGMSGGETPVKSQLLILLSLAVTAYACGFKTAVVYFLAFAAAEVYSLLVFKPKNRTAWKLYILSFLAVGVLGAWIMLSGGSCLYRMAGFFHPREYEPYKTIIAAVENLRALDFKPKNSFLSETGSLYSFTYLHLASTFGFLPVFVLIMLQNIGFAYAAIGALRIKDKEASVLQEYAVLIMLIYFLMSLCSSCMGIPYAEFGAPLLNAPGLEIIFPIAVYIYTEITAKELCSPRERFGFPKLADILGFEGDNFAE